MRYLAEKPKNRAERLRRGLAVVLDDAIAFSQHTSIGKPLYQLNRKTWDDLVDELAAVAERLEFERSLESEAQRILHPQTK